MDKNAIKKYAVWARRELISRVSQRAALYDITEKNPGDPAADSVHGQVLTASEKKERQALIAQIKIKGYEEVMEEIAYTWFNRFSALRFMEVNGYLPSHVRVFTDDDNAFKPQILTEAINLELDGLDMEKVYALKNDNKTDDLFKYLVIVQCNALSSILPGMFQKIEDYTELLFPDNLLREGSAIEQMIALIPEEDWKDQVQIIGWLYQYYNSEKKDDVFAALKKNVKITKENIPAATQLFTPDWIVRYMVENSLGRLWVEGHPNEELKSQWKYYLEEAEQEPEVQTKLAEIRKEYAALKPEDLKCIDPCSGSGHILAYMFDVLVQIYEAQGYTTRDAVRSIVENNIYGLDIDDRAAQLAYFSVMMKGRQYDSRFFKRGVQPHVYAIEESNNVDKFALEYFCNGDAKLTKSMNTVIKELHDAKEYGSILTITPQDWSYLYERFDVIRDDISMHKDGALALLPIVQVAEVLAQKYHAVITNPPYMGNSGMSAKLSDFVKKNYPDSKSDLFSVCIEKGNSMVCQNGFNSMVTMQSWMFLSNFEKMRTIILHTKNISNLMHMENMVMGIAFGTAVTIMQNNHVQGYKGTYNQIKLCDIVDGEPKEFPVSGNRFSQISTNNFDKIPGSPVAYWCSNAMLRVFDKAVPFGKVADPRRGTVTGDDNRFLRLWFEVNESNFSMTSNKSAKWIPMNKGGEFRKWFGNNNYVVNWENDGFEIKNFKDERGKLRSRPQNTGYFLREGITWTYITSYKKCFRYYPEGFAFAGVGPGLFPHDKDNVWNYLAYTNSIVYEKLMQMMGSSTISLESGEVERSPVIQIKDTDDIDSITQDCVNISRVDWDSFETSWNFKRHPLICNTKSIYEAYSRWKTECNTRFNKLKSNEEKLNCIFIDIYGLQDELTPEVEDKDVTVRKADLQRDIKSLISYAVGCMFGRYSLDVEGLAYAGGEWDASKYRSFLADKDNIIPICDDEYFEDDIVNRFVKFIEVVYGKDTLEENLKFIADALGGKGQSREVIRNYFMNDFYSDHCSIYSVTGSGKRPIYWLFDSGKKIGFKCLIYMHRYQPDTIARIRTDYVHEQQSRYRTAIADLENRIAGAGTSERVKLNKQLKKLQDQAEETRVYEEKIHHLADQMIKIDLDDGVKVNYAKFQDVLAKIK